MRDGDDRGLTVSTGDTDEHGTGILGRGWAAPYGLDAFGEAAMAAGGEDVREAIRIILATSRGERVMRPEFGAGLDELVFAPVAATTFALVRHRVEEALIAWEPRIDVQAVRVTAQGPVRNRLDIEIDYVLRATNVFYNLVYPFYLEEGQPT
jgi:phage baseplate assembly protein W